MIKDKLMRAIAAAHNDQASEAFTILDDLRCDNCKHWQDRDSFTNTDQSVHVCGATYIWTKPDFFCALFEEKQ